MKRHGIVGGLALSLIILFSSGCGGSAGSNGGRNGSGGGVSGGGEGGDGGWASIGGISEPGDVLVQGKTQTQFILSSGIHPRGIALAVEINLPTGDDILDLTRASVAGDSKYPLPVVFGYHGSGGTYRESVVGEPCDVTDVESKIVEMTEVILNEGVASVFVESYYSRDERFCEDNGETKKFAPATMDNGLMQNISRAEDSAAAERALCALDHIFDCGRFGRVGTSEGGGVVVTRANRNTAHGIDVAYGIVGDDDELDKLTLLPYIAFPTNLPVSDFNFGIAPACGGNGIRSFSTDADTDTEDLYYPGEGSLVVVAGASGDSVVNHCAEVLGEGTVEIQANIVKDRESISDADFLYEVIPFPSDSGHELWDTETAAMRSTLIDLIQSRLD